MIVKKYANAGLAHEVLKETVLTALLNQKQRKQTDDHDQNHPSETNFLNEEANDQEADRQLYRELGHVVVKGQEVDYTVMKGQEGDHMAVKGQEADRAVIEGHKVYHRVMKDLEGTI